jgi:cysteinyl-tRNA synthetase
MLAAWDQIESVLGLRIPLSLRGETAAGDSDATGNISLIPAPIPTEINSLSEERENARKAKDFKRSDAIRDELKAKGWAIEDTPKGPRLKRL